MAFFVAFYSFKGGVGRTLALANVAYSLAMRGKRVVVIDMDLEAPALLGFPQFALKGKAPKKGFLEYAASFRKRGTCPSIKRYVHPCEQSPAMGKLWVMPSGRIDSTYQATLGSLSWRRLHPRKGTLPLVDGLREALVKEFNPHYVLIDSRTGLSDIGGLSTHLLADMVVLVFNLTRECIEGSIRAYRAFGSETTRVRTIQLVASPIPPVVPSEGSVIEDRIRQAKEFMPRGGIHGVIRIFYDPAMTLSENLAVLRPDDYAASEKYEKLRAAIQRSDEEDIFSAAEEARQRRSEGRWEDGLKQLQAFVDHNPDDAEGYIELGNFLLEAGRADEATACYRSATKLAGDLAIAHRKLGEALVAAGKSGEAVVSLERANALGDESREVFEALATSYARLAAGDSVAEDPPKQLEAQRKALGAQQKALGAVLKDLRETSSADNLTLQGLRDEFIATLSQKSPYRSFEAREIWELLTETDALTSAQKYSVARALLDGSSPVSQTVDLIRVLREEEKSPPADLELRIASRLIHGQHQLSYNLHSVRGKVGYTHHEIPGPTILTDPRKFLVRTVRSIEKIACDGRSGGWQLQPAEQMEELASLGRDLYRVLFPPELRLAYRNFRDRVKTLLIVSDEPWIPWELVKPFDDGLEDRVIDDDFLCCRFELTRWLAGESAPPVELGGTRIASIEAGSPPGVDPLPRAAEESRLLSELAARHSGVESLVLSHATYAEVERVLRLGGHGVLHFVGHGSLDSTEPTASRFQLIDGRSLRPIDLQGAIRTRLQQDRPLVFFNSCQVAQQQYSLSGLGGWPSRWILDCGCGAFVGPQWSVDDASAYLFVKTFYAALERGETIGSAVRQARLRVREAAPGGAAWLAFSAYAHPNARLRLGAPAPKKPTAAEGQSGIGGSANG